MAHWLFERARGHGRGRQRAGASSRRSSRRAAELDLFVTITDFYGYDRQVPIADPRLVHDSRHRHAMAFSYGPGEDQFRRVDNGSLAFAARTTSCFPGVFPPVSFTAFQEWVPHAQLGELAGSLLPQLRAGRRRPGGRRSSSTAACSTTSRSAGRSTRSRTGAPTARSTGGCSTSSPTRATASSPTPGRPPRRSRRRRRSRRCSARPSGIPRHEPILDDLLSVADHNERVAKIRDVIETSFPGVSEFLDGVIGAPESLPEERRERAARRVVAQQINDRDDGRGRPRATRRTCA